jgi:steroid Delta-isomerase
MITREQAERAVQEYCRAETEKDKEAWLSLFAPGIVHEDPVGAVPNVGLERLSRFWDGFQNANLKLETTAPLILCGDEVIVFMRAEAGPDGARVVLEPIIDNMVFDEAGKITRVRTFFER